MCNPRSLLLAALAPLPLLLFGPARAMADQAVIWSPRAGLAGAAVAAGPGGSLVSGLPARRLRIVGNAADAAGQLRRLSGVAWAEPERRMHTLGTADPLQRSQWGLSAIHAQQGWAYAGIGRLPALDGVPIGIVDTGIASGHEDLRGRLRACAASAAGRIREGICDDRDGHGSHVAGIAAAATGNGIGIAGVAATSPLIICRALSSGGGGSTADVAACLAWVARKGAKVVNLSLGGPDSAVLRSAVRSASAAGAVIVAAAGNGGVAETTWPAGYPEVISVAAVDQAGRHADFSNVNRDVEIAAPGVSIVSVKAGGGYTRMSGTSMAAPFVSGAAALAWMGLARPSAAAVRAALDRSVRDAGTRGRDTSYGNGILDLALIA